MQNNLPISKKIINGWKIIKSSRIWNYFKSKYTSQICNGLLHLCEIRLKQFLFIIKNNPKQRSTPQPDWVGRADIDPNMKTYRNELLFTWWINNNKEMIVNNTEIKCYGSK